jgi:hypothetical protein
MYWWKENRSIHYDGASGKYKHPETLYLKKIKDQLIIVGHCEKKANLMTVLWDAAQCSLGEDHRHLRGASCCHHPGDTLAKRDNLVAANKPHMGYPGKRRKSTRLSYGTVLKILVL